MKIKKISGILILLLCAVMGFGEEKPSTKNMDFELIYEPDFGFMYGLIRENVWKANMRVSSEAITYTPTTELSRLDWELYNNKFMGSTISLIFNKKFLFNFNLQNALSGTVGVMEDFDWNSPDPKHLTNYSNHDLILHSFFDTSFLAGYIFHFGKKIDFTFTPSFGFHTQKLFFEGYAGFDTYESNNWEIRLYEKAPVIFYSQGFTATVLNLNGGIELPKYFSMNAGFAFSYINKIFCKDQHIRKGKQYCDIIQSAWLIEGSLKLFYKINKNHKIGLFGGFNFMPDAYGFTYMSFENYEEDPSKPDYSDLGGTSRLIFNYGIVYSFHLR